jgi:MFS family permease
VTTTTASSNTVVRSYLTIAFLYTLSASVIWGINTLFLLDAGLDIFEVFIANAAFTAGMVLFEIPTGVLADTVGRRASFLLSVTVLIVGTAGYVGLREIEAGLWAYVLVSIVLGLGFTFYSGAVEAWLVDALTATGYDGNLDNIFARGAMVSGAAMLIGTTAGGLLATIDLAVPFIARIILLAAAFGVAWFTMFDIGFTRRTLVAGEIPSEMRRIAADSITYGWGRRSVRLLMIGGFIQGTFLTWGFYAWQPYFLDLLESDAVWIAGVVAALVSLSMIIGNAIVEWLTRYCGKRTTLLIAGATVQALAVIGIGLATEFWMALAFLLLAMGSLGVIGPVRQAYLHAVIPSEQRATVVSFDSMVSSGGSVVGQTGLGYLSNEQSISAAYVVSGVVLLAVPPVMWMLRRMDEDADVIVGKTAGCQGPAAAQGLPAEATVDSIPRQPVGSKS